MELEKNKYAAMEKAHKEQLEIEKQENEKLDIINQENQELQDKILEQENEFLKLQQANFS